MNYNNADFLLNLISRETMNTMSGKHKKIYKYAICAVFINLISGKHLTKMQLENISKLVDIQNLPRKNTDFDVLLEKIHPIVYSSLEENHFKEPYNNEFLDFLINFFRQRLRELDDDAISLFQVKDISQILDTNKFTGIDCLKGHHWLEFSLDRHITVTFPEYIVFNDLKVQWNYYLDVRERILQSKQSIINIKTDYEYLKDEQKRHDLYLYGSLHRMLIILCVSFVESYLYDLFLSIKESEQFNQEEIRSILNQNKVQDTEIIKRILFVLFPYIKNDYEFADLFNTYREIIDVRDRFIHASAFIDDSSKKSQLEPLLRIEETFLLKALQNSIDIVKKIDTELPDELKLLYWMDCDLSDEKYNKEIKFNDFSKLSLTNRKAPFNKRDYYYP
jgi:hypothetical protein